MIPEYAIVLGFSVLIFVVGIGVGLLVGFRAGHSRAEKELETSRNGLIHFLNEVGDKVHGYTNTLNEIDDLQTEHHRVRSEDFVRRIKVETRLREASTGERPLPDPDECERLADELDIPDEFRPSN